MVCFRNEQRSFFFVCVWPNLYFIIFFFLKSIYLFIYFFIIIRRLITLQYCSGFCHTLTWISHGFTCVSHPDSPFHLPLHPIPLCLPSAPVRAFVSCIQPGLVIWTEIILSKSAKGVDQNFITAHTKNRKIVAMWTYGYVNWQSSLNILQYIQHIKSPSCTLKYNNV